MDNLSLIKLSMHIIGGRWRIAIIYLLLEGPRRFSDLERGIGIGKRMLSVNLRSMESLGLVTRTAYAEVPPRVEYSLTPQGYELRSLVCPIIKFGERFNETVTLPIPATPPHDE